jgi:hypothetical protein
MSNEFVGKTEREYRAGSDSMRHNALATGYTNRAGLEGSNEKLLEMLGAYDGDDPDVPPPISEAAFDSKEVHDLAKNSLDFLAGLAMPTVFKYFFPPVFLLVWQWLCKYVHLPRDFSQLALGLPRGFGKTAVVKLFILYCILFTQKKFILILCETTDKAINILADVMDMLNQDNIKAVFGDWSLGKEKDDQKLKKFGFRGRDIILLAAGVESGIRGITIKNQRPDVMIMDDIQSRDCAESVVQSQKLEREMLGTAMKAKSPEGCLFLFIANMYPTKHSILRKFKSNPNWIKFIAGGIINNNGKLESLWEDLQPLSQLLKEFKNDLEAGHPEIFYAEVLNDENASANHLIDLTALPELPRQEGDIAAGNFIIIDPSGDKDDSDAVSLGYFEVHQGKAVMEEIDEGRMSPGEIISRALTMGLKRNCRLIAVEGTAFQSSLLYWFKFICEQRQITGFYFVDIYPGQVNKQSRLLKTIRGYAAGEVFVSYKCRAAVHAQITAFNPLKAENTDGLLDLLSYAPKVLENYGEFIATQNLLEQQTLAATAVPDYNSSF